MFFSLCAGALAGFGMEPHNLWPVTLGSLAVLYGIISLARMPRGAFLYAYLFHLAYFICSLNWIGNALLVDGNEYRWAWPLAVCGLPVLLSVFPAFGCYLAKRLFNIRKPAGLLGFIALFAAFEWVRGHIFTGFPWNLYGFTWSGWLDIAQISALGNIYHLTLLTLFWGCGLGFVMFPVTGTARSKGTVLTLVILSFLATWGFGQWRLDKANTEYNQTTQIHIVQPNIEQSEKWDRTKMNGHFTKHLDLSYADNISDTTKTTIIVWPETAINYLYLNDPTALAMIADMLRAYPSGAYLVTGALRRNDSGQYYNSMIAIDANGAITNIYDKHHRVPFGEYIPFQRWIPIEPVAKFAGFEGGVKPYAMSLDSGFKYLPLICYEIIFPTLKHSAEPVDAIINVTNDAWYGVSPGPYQHLSQAKFRAIKSGTPVVRAANTGMSALYDSNGRTLYTSGLYADDSMTLPLPIPNKIMTKSAYFENISLFILIAFLFGCALIGRRKRNT